MRNTSITTWSLAHEALNGAEPADHSRRIQDDLAALQEFGDHPLELERMRGIAEERGGACAVHAVVPMARMAARLTSGWEARLK